MLKSVNPAPVTPLNPEEEVDIKSLLQRLKEKAVDYDETLMKIAETIERKPGLRIFFL